MARPTPGVSPNEERGGCKPQSRSHSVELAPLLASRSRWRRSGRTGRPGTEEWIRTFCIITTNANELVADIHDRMPVIIPPDAL